jgi:hypothetical protein
VKHIVIALFDRAEEAQRAADVLTAGGFDSTAVHVTRSGGSAELEPLPAAARIEGGPATGLLHRLAMLFGTEEPHVGHYVEAVRRGGHVVQVDAADEAQATAARDALLASGAVDIDDRIQEWQQAGAGVAGTDAGATRPADTTAGVPGTAPGASATGGARGVVHREEISIGGVRIYGPPAGSAFENFAADFRADYETRYADPGGTYEEFDPAYRYGHALATDVRHGSRSWADIEVEARAGWERRYPQCAWERYGSAVKHGWERARRA